MEILEILIEGANQAENMEYANNLFGLFVLGIIALLFV